MLNPEVVVLDTFLGLATVAVVEGRQTRSYGPCHTRPTHVPPAARAVLARFDDRSTHYAVFDRRRRPATMQASHRDGDYL
jgi:hypothetical protein